MQLLGLQTRIEVITKNIKIEDLKWKDLKVAEWPKIEIGHAGAKQLDEYVGFLDSFVDVSFYILLLMFLLVMPSLFFLQLFMWPFHAKLYGVLVRRAFV